MRLRASVEQAGDLELEEVQSRLRHGDFVIAYLDDIYIVCDPEHTRDSYDVVKEVLLRRCHIDINMGRLAAWGVTPGP